MKIKHQTHSNKNVIRNEGNHSSLLASLTRTPPITRLLCGES